MINKLNLCHVNGRGSVHRALAVIDEFAALGHAKSLCFAVSDREKFIADVAMKSSLST